MRHIDVLVRDGNRIGAGGQFKRIGLGPFLVASQFTGFIGGGGQIQLERAAGAGNGEFAPVIHRQAGHSRGPAFRDGKGIVDGGHENIGSGRRLNKVVGFLINDGVCAVWLKLCGHGIE
ncbi:hypothetical protein HMPREF3038_01614 [Akkermansia sp. KLE1797]|nr:hypothetical protein HMPREF3038_01614 [Akkermansia sp. KLE1797]KXU54105.1 hypothetical protein HMPREF3039_01770 [Akkermansia sp. KLE1798]KZA05591.1 hypothetical protein HMPREF1326_00766 [Akkermansia sp. KLE1605]